MSLAALIRSMAEAGASPEAIALAVEAVEAASGTGVRHQQIAASPDEKVWVYVIAVDHPGDVLVKVGISKHPHFRMSTLEKERGYNLYLAHTEGPFSRADATALERRAHQVLADERERGEWFLCGVNRATEVVRLCANGNSQ